MRIPTYFIVALCLSLLMACKKKNKLPRLSIKPLEPIGWEEKTPCEITWCAEGTSKKLKGNIKWRGGVSRKYAKHSYSLELDEKFAFSDLPKDDDWIINATYIDKTFMRHKICYDLFRAMDSINEAAECTYVHVSLLDEYQGLYVLMEEVNGGMLNLDKSDTMAMLFKGPPVFGVEEPSYIEDSSNYYQQKYPKISDADKTYYLDSLKAFLFSANDSLFASKISTWVDVENIIDWHLLLLFSNNSDGILKNFYLYKKNAKTPLRIAVWDYDHSFGRDGDNEMNMLNTEVDARRSILFTRLLDNPYLGYEDALKERWFQLRQWGLFSEDYFNGLIEENHAKIRNAVKVNASVWPTDGKWYFDDNTYEEELQIMREFVRLRLKQLDQRFAQMQ